MKNSETSELAKRIAQAIDELEGPPVDGRGASEQEIQEKVGASGNEFDDALREALFAGLCYQAPSGGYRAI